MTQEKIWQPKDIIYAKKELLNMNYSNRLYMLSSYKDKLQAKIQDRKVLKELQKKQEAEKENSKELYKF